MALARRAGQRRDVSGAIWPGFVDAMTALLLVLMFVLSIFMIVQFVLRDTISAQDTQLEGLTAEVASLVDALGLSRARVASLEGQVGALAAERDENRALIAAQLSQLSTLGRDLAAREAELGAAEARITDFEAQVAALIAARDTALAEGAGLRAELAQAAEAEAELLSQQEALQLALAAMRRDLDGEAEALRLEALRAQALEAALAEALANATAQGAEAEALRGQLAEAEAALSAEERRRLSDAAAAEALRRRLETADTELTAMTLALEEQRRRAEETLTLLAAARAGQAELEAALEMEISERDRIAALRAMAERDLAASTAQSLADQRMLEVLNQQVAALRGQVGGLQELLGAARAREDAAQTQIETLGADLNMALAQLAVEQRARADLEAAERERLERFQSEFFGRLREVLEGREEIQIVGDRFLFSSEVLFELGSAELAPAGRAQIGNVVQILREVADEIPPEIDWILRVDGHTDNLPLGPGAEWPDNWALSQARALSVVRYMTEALGFPPQRLAATGFGEYRPVDPANTPEARARNRRIELKLTER
jgi:chemotaxis protein MotB